MQRRMPEPQVSVVIPAYNRQSLIVPCLRSVLTQHYPAQRLDVIVVDDGSSDGTVRAARAFDGVRVLLQEHGGVSGARNLGIDNARGEWIAFLDSDDLWLPDKVRRQIELTRRAPRVGVVFSDAVSFGSSVDRHFAMCPNIRALRRRPVTPDGYVLEGDVMGCLLERNFICLSSAMVRRDALGADRFDPAIFSMEDYDLWLRLAPRTSFGFVDRVLVKKRQHRENISHSALAFARAAMGMIEKVERGVLPVSSQAARRRAIGRWGRKATGGYFVAGQYGRAARALRKALADPHAGKLLSMLGRCARHTRAAAAARQLRRLLHARDGKRGQ